MVIDRLLRNTKPAMVARIKKVEDRKFNIRMVVTDELSHVAIMKMREFLKNTKRFVGTSHFVTVVNKNGKHIDQTTLFII